MWVRGSGAANPGMLTLAARQPGSGRAAFGSYCRDEKNIRCEKVQLANAAALRAITDRPYGVNATQRRRQQPSLSQAYA